MTERRAEARHAVMDCLALQDSKTSLEDLYTHLKNRGFERDEVNKALEDLRWLGFIRVRNDMVKVVPHIGERWRRMHGGVP